MEYSETIMRAPVSSSNLGRRRKCPGSVHAEDGLPKLETDYSKEGTLLHWKDSHPEESRGDLTPEQREVLDRNKALRDKFMDATLPRIGISPEARVQKMVEREFILCDEDGEPVMSHNANIPGHPDVVFYYPDYRIAILFDSKFGRIIVDAAWNNLQIRSYTVMLFDMLDCDTIIGAITQPWAKSPNDLHSAEFSKKDVPAFRREILDIISLTEPVDAPRHASIEACCYCAATAYCPVAITAATDMAVVKAGEVSIPELIDAWERAQLMKKVYEAIQKRMKYILTNFPDQIPTYELEKAKERRSIPNVVLAVKMLRQHGVLSADENAALALCDLSVKEVEEHIRSLEKITKDGAEIRAKDILGALIVKTPMDRAIVKKGEEIHAK